MTTDTTTPETASRFDEEPEERLANGSGNPPDESQEPDEHDLNEANAQAWAALQEDASPFFRELKRPVWLALAIPVALLYIYATFWLCGKEWFQFGSPLLIQPFVPLLALALVWFRRQEVFRRYYELAYLFPEDSPKRRGNTAGTLVMVALACVLMVGAAIVQAPAVVLLSLILATGAVVYGLFGPFILKSLMKPLAFLILTIPPPLSLLDRAVFLLRKGTAFLTVLLAQQFDKLASQTSNASFEPVVHLSSGDLTITPALCGASVMGAVFVLTVWWCLVKVIPALQSILLVAVGFVTAIALNTLRLAILCLLTGAGAFSVSEPNPWMIELSSLVLILLTFTVVMVVARRVLDQMVRKVEVVEIEEGEDDMESDLEDILRGGNARREEEDR